MKTEEDWSAADFDLLLDAATANLTESTRCHEAGAPRAALVMLAGALEALLLATLLANEDDLRAAGQWKPQPSRLHLSDLASFARQHDWLTTTITAERIETLNKARTMAAHPGAFVRGARQVSDLDLGDPIGYLAVYDIAIQTCRELRQAFKVPVPSRLSSRLDLLESE